MADPPKRAVDLNKLIKKKPPSGAPVPPAALPGKPAIQPGMVARERRVQTILSKIDQLPSLPAVVWEVMRLANDPDSSATDFEDYISKDQALTAKLLKLVNSSFYALPNKLTSISRAIVVLGYKTLKSVVMAASTSKLLDRQLQLYGYDKGGLWSHSVACAGVSRHLAGKVFKLGTEMAEEAFVAGLLHDIGKIVIGPTLTENADEYEAFLAQNPDCTLIDLERQVAGIDHAEAGRRMMEKWKLSERLATGIANHHGRQTPPEEGEDTSLESLVMLSNAMCLRLGMGLTEDYRWWRDPLPSALERFSLTPEDLDRLAGEVEGLEEDIQALLGSLRD